MKRWPALALLGLVLLGPGAWAHDTWFEVRPTSNPGELRLALGTGNRFPVQESSVGGASLASTGCRDPQGSVRPLDTRRDGPRALLLQTRGGSVAGLSCWAQQAPQDITLPAHKVQVYLDEIRAPAPVRQRWAELRARGQPWQERYTKHARLEWRASLPQAVPLDMDIVLDGAPPRAGDRLAFTVLHQGRPLPDFAVEVVNAASGLGLWLRTDAQGRAQVTLSLAGDWLLRGTLLSPDPRRPDAWESGFVTLAFSVGADAL